jgi:hypothetical protein
VRVGLLVVGVLVGLLVVGNLVGLLLVGFQVDFLVGVIVGLLVGLRVGFLIVVGLLVAPSAGHSFPATMRNGPILSPTTRGEEHDVSMWHFPKPLISNSSFPGILPPMETWLNRFMDMVMPQNETSGASG